MIAFAELLVEPAKRAGIPVPEKFDQGGDFDEKAYPRFNLFCCVQLGTAMPDPQAHWNNARVIAQVPEDKICSITMAELLDMGLAYIP